jgi:hypothetical protein
MNRAHHDPRPGRPSTEELRKTAQRVSKKLATSSVERKALKRTDEALDDRGPQGPKDLG